MYIFEQELALLRLYIVSLAIFFVDDDDFVAVAVVVVFVVVIVVVVVHAIVVIYPRNQPLKFFSSQKKV